MDFYVVLDRAGYRVAKRRQQLAKVGVQHRVTKSDAIRWFQSKFEVMRPSSLIHSRLHAVKLPHMLLLYLPAYHSMHCGVQEGHHELVSLIRRVGGFCAATLD